MSFMHIKPIGEIEHGLSFQNMIAFRIWENIAIDH